MLALPWDEGNAVPEVHRHRQREDGGYLLSKQRLMRSGSVGWRNGNTCTSTPNVDNTFA